MRRHRTIEAIGRRRSRPGLTTVTQCWRCPLTCPCLNLDAMNNDKDAGLYEIRVRGVLGQTLLSAFPTFAARAQDGITVLSGSLPDQAALFGVLDQVECLGLELLAVRRVSRRRPAQPPLNTKPSR